MPASSAGSTALQLCAAEQHSAKPAHIVAITVPLTTHVTN